MPYAHVVFTVPEQLSLLTLRNQDLLHHPVSRSFRDPFLYVSLSVFGQHCPLAALRHWCRYPSSLVHAARSRSIVNGEKPWSEKQVNGYIALLSSAQN